jgi:MFS family permease
LIVASGLAGSISAPLWGRMSDRSSRRVMVIAAAAAGAMGMATSALVALGPALMQSVWTYTLLFFAIAVFHGGVRLGRKVYLVDMANTDNRSTYVAVSNTIIGVAMLGGGVFGVIADLSSAAAVIGLLGLFSLGAAVYIARMTEVSG